MGYDKHIDRSSRKNILKQASDFIQTDKQLQEFNNKSLHFKPNAVTISIMIKVANELNQINLINTFYEMVKQYQLVS